MVNTKIAFIISIHTIKVVESKLVKFKIESIYILIFSSTNMKTMYKTCSLTS